MFCEPSGSSALPTPSGSANCQFILNRSSSEKAVISITSARSKGLPNPLKGVSEKNSGRARTRLKKAFVVGKRVWEQKQYSPGYGSPQTQLRFRELPRAVALQPQYQFEQNWPDRKSTRLKSSHITLS